MSLSRFFVGRRRLACRARRSWISGRARISAGRPRSSASPRLGKLSLAASENVPRPLIRSSICGAAVPRSRSSGVPCTASSSRSAISGRSSRRKSGSRLMPRLMSPRRSAEASPVRVGLHDPVGHLARARARAGRAPRRSRAPGRASDAVLVGQDREHLVGLAQRRVGAVDDLVQLVAAAGQAGAELAQQDREALAVGQPQDVVEQVEVHRRAGVRERQQPLALAVAAPRSRSSGWRRRRSRARTPRTSRRSATAAGSCSSRPPSRA